MPTQRRRIGFLPRSEVQKIIDNICNHNKLSQSKVTGILVEEALSSRGLLNTSTKELLFDLYGQINLNILKPNKTNIPIIINEDNLENIYLTKYNKILTKKINNNNETTIKIDDSKLK